MKKNNLAVIATALLLAAFFINTSSVQAQSLTDIQSRQQQLATLSTYLNSLKNLLSLLQNLLASPAHPAYAQTAPPTPTITQPTGGTVISPVVIKWSGAVSPNYYSVWKAPNSSSTWNFVSGCSDLPYTTTQCTDSAATGPMSYTVSACTGPQGSPGACSGSAMVSVTVSGSGSPPPSPSPTPAPSATTLTIPSSSGIPVSANWTSVSGATYYSLSRRSPPGSGSWGLVLASTASTTFSDYGVATGTSYEYKANACSPSGCSVDSNYQSVAVGGGADTQPPSTPNYITVSSSTSYISVGWPASSDNVGVTGYKIYRNSVFLTTTTGINYTDTAVTAGISYNYYVMAYDAANNVSSPSPTSINIMIGASGGVASSTVPVAPVISTITSTATPVNLSWTSVASASWHNIYRRTPAGTGSWASLATNIATINYTDNSVTVGTSYEYHVNACNSVGCSPDSNYVSVTLSSTAASSTVPNVPSNLTYNISNSGATVNLFWTDNSTNETRFEIYRQSGGIWNYLTQTGANITNFSDNPPAGTYYYNVAACNGTNPNGGCSVGSNNVGPITTSANPATPAAPSNLMASVSPSGGVYLTWMDNSNNESGFKLYRNSNGVGWTDIGNIGANYTSYTDSGLAAGTYSYHLNAFISATGSYPVYSGISNDVTVTVAGGGTPTPTPTPTPSPSPTPPPVPATPSNLAFNLSHGSTQVDLSWTTNSTNETRFEIYRQPQGGTWIYYAQVGASVTSYFDTNVPAGGYSYQVAACNGASTNIGCSYGSNTVFAMTSGTAASSTPPAAQPVPNAPSNLLLTTGRDASGANNVYLNWTDNSTNELGFKLYRNSNGGGWTDIGNVGAGVTSYADVNLPPGNYTYHLNAYALSGGNYVYSGLTNDAAATLYASTVTPGTTAPPPPPTYVNQPYGLTTSVSGSNVSLTWTNNSSAATSINIGRRSSGGPVWTIVGTTGGSANSYTDVNVPPGNYDYEVFACNSAGCPQQGSNWMPAAVGSALYIDLRVDGMNDTVYRSAPASFTLTWNTAGASGSGCAPSGNWTDVKASKSVPSGSEYYTNVTVAPNGPNPLYYTLTCFNSRGESVSDTVKVQITSAGVFATSTTSVNGAFVKGAVTDASGVSVPGVYVHVFTDGFSLNFSAFTDTNGAFGINLPAGSYWLEISPPSSRSDLIKPAPTQVSVSEGSVKTVTLQFNAGTKTISGVASFSTGQSVTDAEVGAYSSDTHQWVSMFVDQNGRYALRVSGGTWQVGIRPQDQARAKWSWTGAAFPTVTFKTDSSSEAQTVNFTIPVSDARLAVHVVDENGNPLQAGVVVDTVSAAQNSPTGTAVAPVFQKSDASGSANFTLKAGTYYLRAFLPPESGYFNPDEQLVSLGAGQSQDAKLVFKKRSTAATAAIRGTTKLDDGTHTNAFIWAWSEKGDTAQLKSDEKGGFGFPVVAGRWHIGAGKEIGGFPYKSSEFTVDIADGAAANVEITLSSLGKNPLAPPVTVSQPSNQQIIAQSQDGAKVTVPDGASNATGNVSLEVRPTIEAPSQGGAKVVSTVYDINLKDASGTAITSLQKKVEINIPYDPDDLKGQGISEDRIVPSYYDDSTGTWAKADDYTIDKVKHVAIVRVKHLTRFAIIAAADITPPDAPANVLAVKGAAGVVISWKNPATDFDHVKVYRSSAKGSLGKLILNNITDTQASDADVEVGTRYYYTVRAVDPAGNESTNLDQVSLIASGGKSGKLARKLTLGTKGDDVKILQTLLIKDGVYPEGTVSGYFGKFTKAAVIRFQEKYADEILKPVGLTQGSGVVGNATRAKLNRLAQ